MARYKLGLHDAEALIERELGGAHQLLFVELVHADGIESIVVMDPEVADCVYGPPVLLLVVVDVGIEVEAFTQCKRESFYLPVTVESQHATSSWKECWHFGRMN